MYWYKKYDITNINKSDNVEINSMYLFKVISAVEIYEYLLNEVYERKNK